MRYQCDSAEEHKPNFKAATAECTSAPYNEPGIDYPEFMGQDMLTGRTRPDITYSLSVLNRHVANPKVFHAPLVKYLLKYLKTTIDCGLFYPFPKLLREASEKVPEHMLLYTDSDDFGEEKEEKYFWVSCAFVRFPGSLGI